MLKNHKKEPKAKVNHNPESKYFILFLNSELENQFS